MDKPHKQSNSLLQSVASRLTKLFRKEANPEADLIASEQEKTNNATSEPAEGEPFETQGSNRSHQNKKGEKKLADRKHRKNADGLQAPITELNEEEIPAVIANYVQQKIGDPYLGVEMMAHSLKTSRTGLYILMRRLFNLTPANYILAQRLKLAEQLLKEGVSPRETSIKCGFSDPKYFSKVYKKKYGILPSAIYSSFNQS